MKSLHARFVATVIATAVTVACGGSSSPTAPTSTVSSTTLATQTITLATKTITSLSVSIPATTLTVGATATVTATATYSDGTSAEVAPTWTSSAEGVATVSASGTVTAVVAGTATITGTFDGQSGTVGITVTGIIPLGTVEVLYNSGTPIAGFQGYVAYCVQKLLSRKSGHGTRLLVEVDLLTKE